MLMVAVHSAYGAGGCCRTGGDGDGWGEEVGDM